MRYSKMAPYYCGAEISTGANSKLFSKLHGSLGRDTDVSKPFDKIQILL